MKLNAFNKLTDISVHIAMSSENEISKSEREYLLAEIRSIFALEAATEKLKSTKFDIWKFVSADKYRPIMCGVHYEEGLAVASDGRVLVSIPDEHLAEWDGSTRSMDGKLIDGGHTSYPKWRSVLPTGGDFVDVPVDEERMRRGYDEWQAEKKAGLKGGRVLIRVGDDPERCAWLRYEDLQNARAFCQVYGHEFTARIWGPRRAVRFGKMDSDINTCIVMPFIGAEPDENGNLPEYKVICGK